MSSISPSRGFGASKSKGSSVPKDAKPGEVLISIEADIRQRIAAIPELQEAIDIKRYLMNWEKKMSQMRLVDKAMVPESIVQAMEAKRLRMNSLNENWSTYAVHNKIHEITWDASASNRAYRHSNVEIPTSMKNFMANLATESIKYGSRVLDVGCGTGILFDFLQKLNKPNNPRTPIFQPESCVGIDLSGEMISIAKNLYPKVDFKRVDFMEYNGELLKPIPVEQPRDIDSRASTKKPTSKRNFPKASVTQPFGNQLSSQPTSPRTTKHAFNTVVFNECFHYFLEPDQAFLHAISLLHHEARENTPAATNESNVKDYDEGSDRSGAIRRVIISHPKGASNVDMQRRSNELLVPHVLPDTATLERYMTQSPIPCRLHTAPDMKAAHYLAIIEVV